MPETVLVTGAGGFIGSHLVEALAAAGQRVRAFVRYNGRADAGWLRELPAELKERTELVYGDLRDSDAVSDAARGVSLVYHLGALIGIPYSYVHPRETVDTNVTGTLNVLQAARERGVRRVVHTSTSEVYGTAQRVPMDESHPLAGQSPYSASKIGADMLVESFQRSFGLETVTVRPFNTYGPRQSSRAVIPSVIAQALSGDVVRVGDLKPSRDLNYVSDTVAGFVAAGLAAGAVGQVVNLATGRDVSIGALVEQIVGLIGRKVRIESEPARLRPADSEVYRLQGDNTRAQALLGWQPKVGLDQGLRASIEWMRGRLHLYDAARYQV